MVATRKCKYCINRLAGLYDRLITTTTTKPYYLGTIKISVVNNLHPLLTGLYICAVGVRYGNLNIYFNGRVETKREAMSANYSEVLYRLFAFNAPYLRRHVNCQEAVDFGVQSLKHFLGKGSLSSSHRPRQEDRSLSFE